MQSLSTNLPLIRLNTVNPFLLELARLKLDGGAILRKMGLPGQVPVSGEIFASALTVYEIVEEAAAMADDHYMGYRIGQSLELSQWSPIAKAVNETETMGDLLRHFIVSAMEHTSSTEFFLRTAGERSTFGFVRIAIPIFPPAQNDAFYLGFFGELLREATVPMWDPSDVLGTVSGPHAIPDGSKSPRVAQGDFAGMQLSFPTSWQFCNFDKNEFSSTSASVEEAHIPETLVESVRAALRPHLHEHDLNVERAARICGYTRRVLSQKLKGQGTTINKEIAALRAEYASEQIACSRKRIADIGETVGFRDPAVFSRAFKNWTGQSPQEFRRNNEETLGRQQ